MQPVINDRMMSFLVVQWLRHRASVGEGTGSSLSGEVRSHAARHGPPKIVLVSNTVGVASFHMLRDGVGTTVAGEDTE